MENVNDKLYLRIADNLDFIIKLDENIYTPVSFANHLNDKLNATTGYQFNVGRVNYSVVVNIVSQTSFRFFTDLELRTMTDFRVAYNKNDLMSANRILRNECNFSRTYGVYNPYVSGFLDLQGYSNIYIVSTSLGMPSQICGPNNNSGIIKKVPVNASKGEAIVMHLSSTEDYIDVSRQMLKLLHFQLIDGTGKEINLHGGHISFSLLFKVMG